MASSPRRLTDSGCSAARRQATEGPLCCYLPLHASGELRLRLSRTQGGRQEAGRQSWLIARTQPRTAAALRRQNGRDGGLCRSRKQSTFACDVTTLQQSGQASVISPALTCL